MEILSLRIKKKYLEEIEVGRKKIEYREFKKYYHSRLGKKFDRVKFWYNGVSIIKNLKKIRVIVTPDFARHIITTPFCYAIYMRCDK